MKIQKINKEKFKNWTIFLFFLVVSVLNSCSNFFSFDENRTDENKTAAQDDKCIITVSSDFYSNDGSRAAFPDFLLSPDTLYFAEISYTSGSSKKWLGEDSVSDTAVVLKNNYSDVIRFVFCAPQETSAYTLALYACPKQTGSQVSAVKKSAFAQGDAAFELSAGQKVLSSTLNIKLKPQESSGNGKVDLPLSFDPALGIVAAKVNVTKDGVSDSDENNYGFKIEVSGNSATLSAENAPAGTYLAIMKFYISTTCSSSTEVAVNSAVQQVSVYSGMTTDCWFIDGKKHGTTAADGTFTLSALELTKYDFTELYVCGKDGDGESDGKRSFYVSSNFGSSVPDASDTKGDGSMAKPFATVQKAVDTIAVSGDTSKKYTIYVDGTVEPTYADTDLSDETFISIKGTTASNLDLTIKGLSADARAVLNAKQKGRNGGRVLTSKDTSLTLENLKITGGKVNDCGGIYIISGNLTLKKCVVTKNESSNCGGGIHFDGENLIVENSEISENKGDSGGICVAASSAKTKIKDSDIIKNSARSGGGGLDLVGESIIEDCNITDNKAEFSTGGGGGLILAFNNKSCKIIKSVIKNNIAGENGGGIYINGGTLSLESGAAISENTAGKNGGAIYVTNGGKIKLGGSAVITVDDDGNDIWLATGETITVTDELTPGNNAAAGNPKYTARITPETYNVGTPLITADVGVTLKYEVGKFKVTNSTDGHKYEIKCDSSGKNGELALLLFSIDSENKSLIIDSANSYVLNKAFEYAAENSDSTWTIELNNDIDYLETIIVPEDAKIILTSGGSTNKELKCIPKEDLYNHIQVKEGGLIELKNISLVGQDYKNNEQRALYIEKNGNVVLSGNTVVSGFDNNGNGAIYVNNGNLTIKDNVEIKNNEARYGAGFYAIGNSVVTMDGGLITGNENINGNRIIYLGSSAKFYWNGGKIENNKVGSTSYEEGEIINNSGNTMS